MRYRKPALTFEQQIVQLKDRGLTIDNDARARRWLARVSYYRLSAYFLPFKSEDGEAFIAGTGLSSICDLYNFDRKLRLLFLDAVERIEVAVRTAVTYQIGHTLGPFGHTLPQNFSGRFQHGRFMDELRDAEEGSRETFVQHYRRKYHAEEHLPIWMASELLSFGSISKLYGALRPTSKRAISDPYGVPDPVFASWIHALSVVRNVCAHHSRLWNREFRVTPKLPPAATVYWPHVGLNPARLYAVLLITQKLLTTIAPGTAWRHRVAGLLNQYPQVDRTAMGFPNEWQNNPPWAEEPL